MGEATENKQYSIFLEPRPGTTGGPTRAPTSPRKGRARLLRGRSTFRGKVCGGTGEAEGEFAALNRISCGIGLFLLLRSTKFERLAQFMRHLRIFPGYFEFFT
jgi:hypothetical protein